MLPAQSLIPLLLYEFHDSGVGGHLGVLKMYKRVATSFFWAGMKHDVQTYVANCLMCQQNKAFTLAPVGLLQSLALPLAVWDEISMDLI